MRPLVTTLITTCIAIAFNLSTWAQESKYTGALLWKISGNGITTPSYIFGTHHLTEVSFLDEVQGLNEALKSSNVVIGEIDLNNKTELVSLMQQAAFLPQDENPYTQYLEPEDYKKLSKVLESYIGTPLDGLTVLKPISISVTLMTQIYSKYNPKQDDTNQTSMDEFIQQKASSLQKEIKGLETPEDQIKILFDEPINEQLEGLMCMINELELTIETVQKLTKLYKERDLNGLYKLSQDTDQLSACPMERTKKHELLDNRNNKWMKQLPQLLEENSNFIAVGALHLAGEEGLLLQLEKAGYTVEAVN